MAKPRLAPRLRRLPVATVLGREVRSATGFHARLLGLAFLDRADAGPGLLVPRCSSVHTFGMRFALDLYFLDEEERILHVRRAVPARRVVSRRDAHAVLEIPAREGGEFSPPGP
ncbi:MAG TPA: DUF192 domain-containing protein [Solirubrobacterales bacterium]